MSARRRPYWVYVLYSDSGDRFYTGLSEDVDERLRKHNAGRSRWTARHRPWRCVFRREFRDLTEARRFERLLKRQKGGDGLFRLTGLRARDFRVGDGS
jgi:putative endonuclease